MPARPEARLTQNVPPDGAARPDPVAPAEQKPRMTLRAGPQGGAQPPAAGPGPKAGGRKRKEQDPVEVTIREVAGPAKIRPRHRGALLGLIVAVLLPTTSAGIYLYTAASDQYSSRVGFSVRREETGSAVELLGGLSAISGSSSSDTDILYEYLQSQELVRSVDELLDLRSIYSFPEGDPVFTFDPDGTIEDLVTYWRRMVRIGYDSGTGLIELQVLAFRPEDATRIAEVTFDQSSSLINELSQIARDDATRYAREELEAAVERLKGAREALTAFRSRTQIVDPTADIQGQMGLVNTLQQQLADALIETDLLIANGIREGDPRSEQIRRRVDVIQNRILDERRKLGAGGTSPSGEEYATLFSEFERLSVDREFAEQAYTAALSTLDAALADAQRKNRYLAAFIKPTRAERSEYPRRGVLVALVALFSFMGWGIVMLIYYSIRDRR